MEPDGILAVIECQFPHQKLIIINRWNFNCIRYKIMRVNIGLYTTFKNND